MASPRRPRGGCTLDLTHNSLWAISRFLDLIQEGLRAHGISTERTMVPNFKCTSDDGLIVKADSASPFGRMAKWLRNNYDCIYVINPASLLGLKAPIAYVSQSPPAVVISLWELFALAPGMGTAHENVPAYECHQLLNGRISALDTLTSRLRNMDAMLKHARPIEEEFAARMAAVASDMGNISHPNQRALIELQGQLRDLFVNKWQYPEALLNVYGISHPKGFFRRLRP